MDTLDKLKQDIQAHNVIYKKAQDEKRYTDQKINENTNLVKQKEKQINQAISDYLLQQSLLEAREREEWKDELRVFSHQQGVMNEQIIQLMDTLTRTDAIESVYETKRENLEFNHQQQKEALETQINAIKTHLSEKEELLQHKNNQIQSIEQKIDDKNKDYQSLSKRLILKQVLFKNGSLLFVFIMSILMFILGKIYGHEVFSWFGL